MNPESLFFIFILFLFYSLAFSYVTLRMSRGIEGISHPPPERIMKIKKRGMKKERKGIGKAVEKECKFFFFFFSFPPLHLHLLVGRRRRRREKATGVLAFTILRHG